MNSPRRLLAAVVLIAAFAAVVRFFTTRPSAYAQEIVESSAIAMVDFTELHADLSNFIDRLRNKQVAGRSTSEFPDLWQHTISDIKDAAADGLVWYHFTLPMTPEQKMENENAKEQQGGVPCWPMLGVRVDKKKSVIVRAAVYTQCL